MSRINTLKTRASQVKHAIVPGDLLTVREAAIFLRLHEKSLRELVFRGEIPAFRLTSSPRGRLRFRKSVLESWVRDREAEMRRETEVG